MFEDGNPHEFTFINTIAIDGACCLSPMIQVKQVTSYEEFDKAVEAVNDGMLSAAKEDLLIVRAVASATLRVFKDMHENGEPNKELWCDLAAIAGAALGASQHADIERAMGFLEHKCVAMCAEFLEHNPIPKPSAQ